MFLEVHTSFENLNRAKKISYQLVEEGLAACANLLPASSIYRWKGAIEKADEVIVIFKTNEENYPVLEARLTELHPYETPMIVAQSIDAGSAEYLRWLKDSLG